MSTWLAAGLATAGARTYVCCIHPMLRGSCRMGAKPVGVEHDLAELRAQQRSMGEQADSETSESR
ncbi:MULTISPECIES: hypothetical protein [Nocardia]|uniref:hypothetical protein n=1 Tax=Nocardia TaxID=1817 RepID=UPI0005C13E11|nr:MULTISPECIES: hypothetical protein [Nocardia]